MTVKKMAAMTSLTRESHGPASCVRFPSRIPARRNKRMQQTAWLGSKRKVIAVMNLARLVKRSASRNWGGSTPPLMRRAVRRLGTSDVGDR